VILGWLGPSSDLATLLSLPARASENPACQFPVQRLHHIQQSGWRSVTCSKVITYPESLNEDCETNSPIRTTAEPFSTPGCSPTAAPSPWLPRPLKHVACRHVVPPCEPAEPSLAGRQAEVLATLQSCWHQPRSRWDDGAVPEPAVHPGHHGAGAQPCFRAQFSFPTRTPPQAATQTGSGRSELHSNQLGVAGRLLAYPRATRA